jgi:hypothetical protein
MRWSRNAKALVAGLLGLAGLALALGVVRFKRFVDEDPRLCATCHRASPEFALWMGGSHRDVSCQRCHHSTPQQGLAMLRSFLAGRSPKGNHAEVEVGACASCHFSHDPRWPQVGGSRGHRIHFEQNKIACVRCHAASMHGFEPVAAKCQECHPGHAVGVKGMSSLHCFACHDFLTKDGSLRPTRRDCLHCHTAQGIHAPMNVNESKMDCAGCHKPHRPKGQTLAACTECHLPAGLAKAGLHGRAGHRACLDCHRPHVWTPDPGRCVRCHAGAPEHAGGKGCLACHPFGGAPLPRAVPAAERP